MIFTSRQRSGLRWTRTRIISRNPSRIWWRRAARRCSDAEHFFDGYRANPDYALTAIKAAYEAGARWIVLCDTNGGTMPAEVGRITAEVIAAGIPGDHLGIHTHNDTENAVACSLAAIDAVRAADTGHVERLGRTLR